MNQVVSVLYKNWKGVTAWRRVQPQRLWFGASAYHPEAQLFLKALDLDKNETRDFAVRDIQEWDPEDAEVRTWINRARPHGP